MKKVLFSLFCILFMLTIAACQNTKESSISSEESSNIPSLIPSSSLNDGTLDDNGTEGVDTDERISLALDPNHVDGLHYEYNGAWGYNKDYKKPGLFETDGSIHVLPTENQQSGNRINVLMFGAKANDKAFDNTQAVRNALASAKAGDVVYFPAGKFYFSASTLSAPYTSHIYVYTSDIQIIGAGKEATYLISNYDATTNLTQKTATLTVMNAANVTIRDLSFTAEVPEDCMPNNLDTSLNNPAGNQYAPNSQIVVVATDPMDPTSNIVIKNCKISFFQENGVLLSKTRDCTVKQCEISDATDIGGGGAGYGILIRGNGFESFQMVGTNMDSRYNFITENKLKGPYLRHAIILSYVTHNNLIYNNEIDGCQDEPLDLHGEDEFLNVLTKNKVKNVAKTGIGLGNPGSTHDATGPGNIIYGNEVDNAAGGIQVSYGTPDTQIFNNHFKNLKENTIGIHIVFGPNTTIKNNIIANIQGKSKGIAAYYSYVWNNPEEGLSLLNIQSNEISNVKTGLYFEAYQVGTKIKNNQLKDCAEGFMNNTPTFEMPPKSNYFDKVEGENIYPTQEGNINRGNYTSTINPSGYYYFKGSHEEPLLNRIIYQEFTIDQTQLDSSTKVYLRITTTSKGAKQHFFFWAAENIEWEASELTWGNAPYVNNHMNNTTLGVDPTGEYDIANYPYESKIYDPNKECKLITDFECVVVNEAFLTYYIDITDFMKSELTSNNFTIIITNETMDAAYSSVRNTIGNPQDVWPSLIFSQ